MAAKIYIKDNWLLAEDSETRKIFLKISSKDAMHLRDSNNTFAFFYNIPQNGTEGVVFTQLGAMQEWSIFNDEDTQNRVTQFGFLDIVKEDGLPYASADELDNYLNQELGEKSSSVQGLTEVTHDSTLAGNGTKDNPLSVVPTAGGYFKDEVLITSGTISASASDQAVPGLTYTIPSLKGGDYVFYAVISVDIDNDDMKPLAIMLFKNGTKQTNSETVDFAKKNEKQSVQLTYALDGLVPTDVIAVYVNNDHENINAIIVGRILAQKFV